MPTARPRITVTLTEHQHNVLWQLAQYTGQSMSAIVGGLVEVASRSMERTVSVLIEADVHRQAARDMARSIGPALASSLAQSEAALQPIVDEFVPQADLFRDSPAVTVAPPVADGARSAASAGGGSTPVPVTRGSGRANGTRTVANRDVSKQVTDKKKRRR